jgi:tRNA modification GTPase
MTEDDELVADAVKCAPNVVALNKSDLPPALTAERLRTLVGPCPIVELSARSGAGLEELVAVIGTSLFGAGTTKQDDEVTIFRSRHFDAARIAVADLASAEESLAKGMPLEIVASDLTAAATSLAEITGEVTSEDVLDRVFADFCLGK